MMSGNPNMQKIGKRKNAPGRQQADWLFPSAGKPSATLTSDQLKSKRDEQLAKDLLKRRATGEPPKSVPPPQLLELIGAFLTEHEFTATSKSLQAEIENRGEKIENIDVAPSLSTIYNEWRKLKDEDKVLGTGNGRVGITTISHRNELKKGKAEKKKLAAKDDSSSSSDGDSSSSEDSDIEMRDAPIAKKVSSRKSSSSSSSSASSSSSDSDADDENEAPPVKATSPKPKINGLKRKASSTSSSSASNSSSVSSSEDDQPKAKKVKTTPTSASSRNSSPSSSESGSSSSSGEEAPTPKQAKKISSPSSSSSGSDSDSSSESDAAKATTKVPSESRSSSSESESESDSDSSTNSLAQKTPLPDSESDSSSDSSSESGSDSSSDEANKKPIISSDTSATLSDAPKKMTPSPSESSSSSDSEAESKPVKVVTAVAATTKRKLSPPLPPELVLKSQRKTNVPFSRIPKDIKVDDRLASNAFVPYHYANKAHEDLIVTKGKAFTKEKNKKKRGSYKGGYIDVEGKKGIKFDD